ncbi:DUF4351 domain-containing protein [Sphaerospermopsis aphanizomenoides BCCUSP55]|uniref:DUF4351 domain-containing protein n=1 Tax=Sphaerospermopsis aphanizomenoides TaxID=459663 RepID=UPI001902C7C1|nr:DUF4351 domain-containing protein [Sphaerospermopsis aphanizomenoides]MBK1990943.1 DUF4351 domain-containing protein [Sphaerospermopsis aphanizomenoides BCCUSP55]
MTELTANYDESWKEALNEYFESFLFFFFPQIHELIDWKESPQPLDKELQEITASSETEKRIADKLYKVWLLDKQQIWILIHVEVQSHYDVDFAERMFIYHYRAFDLYHNKVLSLAILGDDRPNWRPDCYHYSIGGGETHVKFPTAKLLDYESRWNELESSNNPFAIITMAHLKTKSTISNFAEREAWKWKLIRELYEQGLTKEQIVKLFKIIDTMMTLPKHLQEGLITKIKRLEEERKMPLVSPTEKLAMERSEQQGIQQGEERLIIRQLNRRFGVIASSLIEQIHQLSVEQLELLGEALLDFSTIADLEQWLQNKPNSVEE